jgi:hypothetical protein
VIDVADRKGGERLSNGEIMPDTVIRFGGIAPSGA